MSESIPPPTRERFLALDGLRGLAAVAVLLYHVRSPSGMPWLAPHGYLAVDFFFALSGFVIAYAYRPKLEMGDLSPARFLVRRFVRLWPSSAFGTMLGLTTVLVGRGEIEGATAGTLGLLVLLGLVLVPQFGTGGPFFPLNSPQWSLFDELAANAVYALGAFRLRLRGLIIVTVAAGLFAAWISFATGGREFAGPQRVVYPYFAGALIYELRASGHRLLLGPAAAFLLAFAVVAAFFVPSAESGTAEALVCSVFTLFVFPVAVWALADMELPRLTSLCKIAGEASYPLYAIHLPLLRLAVVGVGPLSGGYVAAVLGGICLIAVAVARAYDIPVRHFLIERMDRGTVNREEQNTFYVGR